MSGLRGFKFVTTLVLEFKKIDNDDKTIYSYTMCLISKAEQIINKSDIDYVFGSIYRAIILNLKNLYEKAQVRLLIQS